MKKIIAIISGLALPFFIFLQGAQLRADEVRNFKDWWVKCDENLYCMASTSIITDKTIGVDYRFSIARTPYAKDWEISLINHVFIPEENSPIDILIDNYKLQFFYGNDFAAYDRLNQYYFLGERAQILFNKIIPASELRIILADKEGQKYNLDFSLHGLSASLLFIDELQNRLGDERSAGSINEGRKIVIDRQPHKLEEDLLTLQIAANNCDPLEDLPHGGNIMSFRLDASSTLHLIPCWAGAYNFAYTAYKQDEYGIEQLLFASYSDETGWSGTKYLVNPHFNERYNRLSDFYKGRGIGDCGSLGLWQWEEYYFILLKYAYKANCDAEVNESEIGNFPAIFVHSDYTEENAK